MARKEKTSHTITISEQENKNDNGPIQTVEYVEDYFSVHTMSYHPATKKFVEREAQRLMDWAKNDDSIIIQDFYDQGGYGYKTFYRWVKKFPELEAAHEYAMSRIGARREYGALTKRLDPSTVARTLGAYHHIWRDQTRELAQLKEDVAQSEVRTIVIERFPELPSRTPEEVAGEIHRATKNAKQYGPQRIPEGMEE